MPKTLEIAQQCSVPGCEQHSHPSSSLGVMCRTHFIKACYRELEELNRSTHTWSVGTSEWEAARRFVQECVKIASSFTQQNSELSNLERAQLVDISIWASELGQRLRRAPRNPLVLSIRLISEMPAHCWEEETKTLDFSHHGARVNCHHSLKQDDILKVLRLDNGEQLEARVVWQRQISPSTNEIGIEFLYGEKA